MLVWHPSWSPSGPPSSWIISQNYISLCLRYVQKEEELVLIFHTLPSYLHKRIAWSSDTLGVLLHFTHEFLHYKTLLSTTDCKCCWPNLLAPLESTTFRKNLKEPFDTEQRQVGVLTSSARLLYLGKFWAAVTAWAKTTLSSRIEQIKKPPELEHFRNMEGNRESLNTVLHFVSASNENQNEHVRTHTHTKGIFLSDNSLFWTTWSF